MTTYILHGGHAKHENQSNDDFFTELQKDVPTGGTVLLINFAREVGFCNNCAAAVNKIFIKNAGDKKLNYLIATEENFIEQVKQADAIFMTGGDTFKLLNTLKKFPDFAQAIAGKVVAGTSAGAYVLARYFYNNDEPSGLAEGLGILPIRLHCHHQGEENVITELNKYDNNLELILLADYEWRVINR